LFSTFTKEGPVSRWYPSEKTSTPVVIGKNIF